jgi:hypothetical protein
VDGEAGRNRSKAQNINKNDCCADSFNGIIKVIVNKILFSKCSPHASSSSGFLGGISVVRVYIQARQDYLQQIPSIYLMDSDYVRIS